MLTSSFLLSPSRSSCFIRVLNLLSHWCSYNFELTHDAKHTKIRARSDIYVQHTTDINQKYRENSQQTRLWWAHSNTPQLAQLPHRLHAGNSVSVKTHSLLITSLTNTLTDHSYVMVSRAHIWLQPACSTGPGPY